MHIIKIVAAIGTLVAAPVFAACDAPESPALPDGASASMEDMLAGQKAVKDFQAGIIAYRECMDKDIATAKAAVDDAENKTAAKAATKAYAESVEAYNKAVAREEAVAGDFNTQIRAYKAANAN